MREMKDASTDIIVVSNELFCKEEIAKDFDKHFSRGCDIIEVTSLQPISIMQRIVYALLEKNSFVARDADHIVFTLLSEYSRGAATIVHMLTSLMQKSEDNSRTGFELAKQQLKLHIAHMKVEQSLNGCSARYKLSEASKGCIVNTRMKEHDKNARSYEQPGSEVHPDDKEEADDPISIMQAQANTSEGSEPPASIPLTFPNGTVNANMQNEMFVHPNVCSDNPHDTEAQVTYRPVSEEPGIMHMDFERFEVDESASTIQAKPDFVAGSGGDHHPLYMYINDILTNNISLPAHYLLNSLVITGPIPLPLFYVEELNNVVMNTAVSKEKKRIQNESPIKELVKVGAVRSSSYPIVYHRNLNPGDMNTTVQPMFIPKLICDAVNDQMDDVDKALSVLPAQRALENLLTAERSLIHLHYFLILCDQLQEVCSGDALDNQLFIASQKLKLKLLVSSLLI